MSVFFVGKINNVSVLLVLRTSLFVRWFDQFCRLPRSSLAFLLIVSNGFCRWLRCSKFKWASSLAVSRSFRTNRKRTLFFLTNVSSLSDLQHTPVDSPLCNCNVEISLCHFHMHKFFNMCFSVVCYHVTFIVSLIQTHLDCWCLLSTVQDPHPWSCVWVCQT